MQPLIDVIRGALKIDNLPDLACAEINSFADAIRAFPQFATVEVPTSVSGIIFSPVEPTTDDTNKLWVKVDVNGNFIGVYVFTNGDWNAVYLFPPGHIEWLAIDSRSPPKGFTLINALGPTFIDSSVRTHLMAQYLLDPTLVFYVYAAYAFTGY